MPILPRIWEALDASLDNWLDRRVLPPHFVYHVGPIRTKKMPLEVTLTTEQEVEVSVSPVTAGGQPAALDGAASFTVQSGDCTVQVEDDTHAVIQAGGTLGDSVVLVAGDADLGSGLATIQDTVTVHVVHAAAQSLGLALGTPGLKSV
jgi:hypothetical protein